MAQLEFGGVYGDAHSESDTGGEFVLANVGNLSFLENIWYFPVYDMVTLYHQQNFTAVTYQNIIEGNMALFAESEAMRHGAGEVEFLFSQNSTLLQEELYTFWLGGIDDMATWTVGCWSDIMDWVQNGVYPNTPVKCKVEPQPKTEVSLEDKDTLWKSRKEFLNSKFWKTYGDAFTSNVEVVEVNSGVMFKNKEDPKVVMQRLRSTKPLPMEKEAEQELPTVASCAPQDGTGSIDSSNVYFNSQLITSYLGESTDFGDFNYDGIPDIVMGAPGYWVPGSPHSGAVVIEFGQKSTKGIKQTPINFDQGSNQRMVFKGTEGGARFGTAVAVVDLNCDGLDDLVVSAPSSSWSTLNYYGILYVYLSDSKTKIFPKQPTYNIYVPGMGVGSWVNLGTSLTGADIDGDGFKDLIIGAKYASSFNNQASHGVGLVSVFLSSTMKTNKAPISIGHADWNYQGEPWSWFGGSIQVFKSGKDTFLLVGATHQASSQGVSEVGALYAFNVTQIKQGVVSKLWSIVGNQKFDKVGSHVSVGTMNGRTFLAISAPSRDIIERPQDYWQAGTVIAIGLDQIKIGSQSFDSLAPKGVLLKGIDIFGRVGWATTWQGNSLWISQPFDRYERGSLYRFDMTQYVPGSQVNVASYTANQCIRYFQGPAVQARYGATIRFRDLDHDGIADLVVTAPRESGYGIEMGGAVYVLYGI